ncbi:foldase [Sporosarcina sp. PTS2304]|uniref:peptidylprolyl isomerase n=1 Tax=Sporosarcina sp. PTS2304 TaxID=2283194 RepID=UPI000E0D590A|nr:peptidylprolyl isomerase [Sporosarcina sp. PTS2304]AXH99893.1 foldase [Sporosarcina sp. PTS2304]
MKKKFLAFTLAASVVALSACSGGDSEVVMSSKAGDVTKDEFYQEMKTSVGEQALQMIILEKVLEDKYKVDDKQVDAEFDKNKEQLGENFEAFLAQQGQTPDSFKKMIRLNKLQEAALTDGIEVSDEELNKRIEETQTEINARHILVEDEETAKEAKEKLDKGEDFAKVAKEYSTDPGSKEEGGELDWFAYGVMVPEFWSAAYDLEPGTISEPVQSDHGFHIIEVKEKRQKEDKKITDEKKDEIRQELLMEKADESELLAKVSKLVEDADVKIKDEDLKSALDLFKMDEQPAPEEEPIVEDQDTDADVEVEETK